MNATTKKKIYNDAKFYFNGLEARKNILWDHLMKTKSKRTENLMFEVLSSLEYASDFIKEVMSNIECRPSHKIITFNEWQDRLHKLNPNFELLEVGMKELVIRCAHCGAIFTRAKNSINCSLDRCASSYCACCQHRNGKYKEKADYTAVMHPVGGLAVQTLDLKPGTQIKIQIAEQKTKIAG